MHGIMLTSLASLRYTDVVTGFRRDTFASGRDLEVLDSAADENVLCVQKLFIQTVVVHANCHVPDVVVF